MAYKYHNYGIIKFYQIGNTMNKTTKELFSLIEKDDGEGIKKFFGDSRPDYMSDAQNDEDEFAIIVAAKSGKKNAFKALVFGGADLNCCDKNEKKLIDILCETNNYQMIAYGKWLDKAFNFDKNKDGLNPLMVSVMNENIECIESVCYRIADIDEKDKDNNTSLHLAVKTGNPKIVESVINALDKYGYSIDPDIKNNEGMSAYELAHKDGNTEMLSLISNYTKKLDNEGMQKQFSSIVLRDDLVAVDRELKNGFNPNYEVKNKKISPTGFPLGDAVLSDNMPMIQILIENKADINFETYDNLNAMACAAHLNDIEKSVQYAEVLLNNGASFYMKKNKYELLKNIIESDNADFLNFMIEKGLDVDGYDNKKDMISYLLSQSMRNYSEKCATMLIQKHELNINSVDKNGNSLLHISVLYAKKHLFSKLLKMGASLDIKNNEGETPRDLSAIVKYKKLDKTILEHENKSERSY